MIGLKTKYNTVLNALCSQFQEDKHLRIVSKITKLNGAVSPDSNYQALYSKCSKCSKLHRPVSSDKQLLPVHDIARSLGCQVGLVGAGRPLLALYKHLVGKHDQPASGFRKRSTCALLREMINQPAPGWRTQLTCTDTWNCRKVVKRRSW